MSKKSVTNSLSTTRRGGINGIFNLMTNENDQQVFGAVLGSLRLTVSFSYFDLKKLIAFDNSKVLPVKTAWSNVFDPF